jgi:hypothetical protein
MREHRESIMTADHTTAAGAPAAKKTATAKKPAAAKKTGPARQTVGVSGNTAAASAAAGLRDAIEPPGSPRNYRARVRMYRQGLGDCFLVTFPRKRGKPFHMLIDCGVLKGTDAAMTAVVEHIRDTVRGGAAGGKARLDVVVGTHEHKDHLSGFNQARDVFEDDFEFRSVWLGWTENLAQPEIKKIKEARKKAVEKLEAALDSPLAAAAGDFRTEVKSLLQFSRDDDPRPRFRIADALEYLKECGRRAGDLRYLDPGTGPFTLEGVEGVRVYVLGPPRDPILLKGSEVTEQMKKDGTIYHLAARGDVGMDALGAAISAAAVMAGGPAGSGDTAAAAAGALDAAATAAAAEGERAGRADLSDTSGDRYYPFAAEHRIAEKIADPFQRGGLIDNPYYEEVRGFVETWYNDPSQAWRRIDGDWLNAFGQLALDLDSDTNNTSLVLAFEFEKTGEVLLFVGDAQVDNWRSWGSVQFRVPGQEAPLPAHDLLRRTVFYKVGHHCSHNATLKQGGLELMTSDDLVAFIPLDEATARSQGKKGWDMPAAPLFKALNQRAHERVVLSDTSKSPPAAALKAGVIATDSYIDYYLT